MLAISNYYTFRENTVYETIEYLKSIQKQINKYLDNLDTINAMLVITAPMQHQQGQRDDDSCLNCLETLPISFSL